MSLPPESELAKLADHLLLFHPAPEADLGSIVATGSSLASAALLDALVEAIRVGRGYSWRDFFFTHPSEAVGKNAEQLFIGWTRRRADDGAHTDSRNLDCLMFGDIAAAGSGGCQSLQLFFGMI